VHHDRCIKGSGERSFDHNPNDVVVAVTQRNKGEGHGVQHAHNQTQEPRDLHQCQQEQKAKHGAKVTMDSHHRHADGTTHPKEGVLFVQGNGEHGSQRPPDTRNNQKEEEALKQAQKERQGQEPAIISAAKASEEVTEADSAVALDRIKYGQIESPDDRAPENDGNKQLQQTPHNKVSKPWVMRGNVVSGPHVCPRLRLLTADSVMAAVSPGAVELLPKGVHTPASTVSILFRLKVPVGIALSNEAAHFTRAVRRILRLLSLTAG